MQNLKFIMLLMLGVITWSCTPKVAQTMKDKSTTDGSENAEVTINLTHPPVAIDGGVQINALYERFPNEITIQVEGGSSEHMIVGATSGTLTATDASKGRYFFFPKHSGRMVEIYAEDTINNITVAESYEVVPMPAPNAFVWTYRKAFSKEAAMDMDAITFRTQNTLVLHHSFNVPILCESSSFKITYINSKGERNSHLNEDSSGKFDAKTLEFIQAAQTGDIFIFEDITTSCSPKQIENIVYILK